MFDVDAMKVFVPMDHVFNGGLSVMKLFFKERNTVPLYVVGSSNVTKRLDYSLMLEDYETEVFLFVKQRYC